MKTGEGKTLVATLAIFECAHWQGGPCSHRKNDYLAKRDADWMGKLYGLTVGMLL